MFINNIRDRKPLPVYGKDENVRDCYTLRITQEQSILFFIKVVSMKLTILAASMSGRILISSKS